MIYEGEVRDSDIWTTILGPEKGQETYLVQGLFEKYFEMV
jgi:hypothetical protein